MFDTAPSDPAPVPKKTSTQPAKKWGSPSTTAEAGSTKETKVSSTVDTQPTSTHAIANMFKNMEKEEPKKQEPAQKAPKQEQVQPAKVGGPPQSTLPQVPSVLKAKVLYDYAPNSPKEIPLKVGQTVVIHTKDQSGWWEGELESGERGWIPMNFVELI